MPFGSSLRRALIAASGLPGADRAVDIVEGLAPRPRNRLVVLTYHRVARPGEEPDLWPGLISATPEAFERQAAVLAERYRVVSIGEVLAAVAGETRLPERAVAITFDDAYGDFGRHAWPVLRRRGLPVTLFVPTAYPDAAGAAFWWDRLYAAVRSAPLGSALPGPGGTMLLAREHDRGPVFDRLRTALKALPHDRLLEAVERIVSATGHGTARNPVLGWDDLRRLAAEGVALAPHTRTHPLLTRIGEEAALAEVTGSLDDLRARVPSAVPVLAYPSGAHDATTAAVAARAGCVLAFTTARGGFAPARSDAYRIPRINVGGRTPAALIRAQVVWASRTAAPRSSAPREG